MGILSDFFLASRGAVPHYAGGRGLAPEDVCSGKRITPLEAGHMLAILRGGGDAVELCGAFELLTPEEADEWTMSVPDDMVDALAALDAAAITRAAEQLAVATSDELGWSPADFEPLLTKLAALGRRARAQGKAMYLWNSM